MTLLEDLRTYRRERRRRAFAHPDVMLRFIVRGRIRRLRACARYLMARQAFVAFARAYVEGAAP